MANKSGKNGKLMIGASKILGVRNIVVNTRSNNPRFATSETAGHKRTVGGTKDFDISADIVLDTDLRLESQLQVGDAATLLVHEDATQKETYPVRLETRSQTIDINDGGEQTLAVTFTPGDTGVWTFAGGGTSS